MSVLELEKLVESLSETEKTRLRELLGAETKQQTALSEDQPDLSWLDELQARARALCEQQGARSDLPTDLAATFRQRKRDALSGHHSSTE